VSKRQIFHRWSGAVLWEGEADTIKDAIHAALKSGADLSRANLSRADLSGAALSGANLYGANLYGADLSRANLYGANLYGANLSGANLSRANLSGANLSGADLSGAALSGADLYGADLYGADLSRANLYGANLSGANLSGANLYGADLSGANLSGANLSGAHLSRADLYDANLSRANLSGADLSGANLSDANLSGANGAQPERCTPLLMLLDQPGSIRAYKLVTDEGIGPFNGGITYQVGESYEVADADTNPHEHCAAGINVATLDWCLKEWQQGYRVLIVEFTAADIACIPTATDGKFRLHRCRVVGEKDITPLVQQPVEVSS
jgi:uncharacterized protein YjbI with pentapeptide repeats